MSKHSMMKDYVCGLCDLKGHDEMDCPTTQSMRVRCPRCGRKFYNQAYLIKHADDAHPEVAAGTV